MHRLFIYIIASIMVGLLFLSACEEISGEAAKKLKSKAHLYKSYTSFYCDGAQPKIAERSSDGKMSIRSVPGHPDCCVDGVWKDDVTGCEKDRNALLGNAGGNGQDQGIGNDPPDLDDPVDDNQDDDDDSSGSDLGDADPGIVASCTDPDGRDYFTKNTVVVLTFDGVENSYVDYCDDEGYLVEYICDTDVEHSSRRQGCEHGCVDGACLPAVEDDEPLELWVISNCAETYDDARWECSADPFAFMEWCVGEGGSFVIADSCSRECEPPLVAGSYTMVHSGSTLGESDEVMDDSNIIIGGEDPAVLAGPDVLIGTSPTDGSGLDADEYIDPVVDIGFHPYLVYDPTDYAAVTEETTTSPLVTEEDSGDFMLVPEGPCCVKCVFYELPEGDLVMGAGYSEPIIEEPVFDSPMPGFGY